jgi:hypothetical protein
MRVGAMKFKVHDRKAPIIEEHNPVEPLRLTIEATDQASHEALVALAYIARQPAGILGVSLIFQIAMQIANEISDEDE